MLWSNYNQAGKTVHESTLEQDKSQKGARHCSNSRLAQSPREVQPEPPGWQSPGKVAACPSGRARSGHDRGRAPFPRSRFQARPGQRPRTAGMRCPPPTAPSLSHPRGSAGTARAQPGTKRHQHFQTRVPPTQAERGTATRAQLPTKSRPAERRKRRPEVTLGRHRGALLSSFSPPSTFSLLRQPSHRGLAHNAASLFPPPALLEGPHGMRGPSLLPFLSPPPMLPRNSHSRPDALPLTLPSAPPQVGGRDPPGERQRAPSRSPGLTLKMA